jgi:MscS family membrane protein
MKTPRLPILGIILVLLLGNSFSSLAQTNDTLPATDTLQLAVEGKDTIVILVQNQSLVGGLRQKQEKEGPPSLSELISLPKIFWAIVLIIIGYFFIRFLTAALSLWSEKDATRRVTLKGLIPMVRIFGWISIVYLVIAGVFHPPVETVVAVGASLGIAIGFASQDILKNIFAGVVILLDKPFSVGDKIEVGSYYGEVKAIGLRSTRIVTADDSLVAIPNAEMVSQSVSNANAGEENCLVVAELWLPIDIDTERVRQIATESAQVSKYIFLNKPISVLFFNEVKQQRSYLKMRLKAYVMDIRFEFAFKSEMTEIVMRELIQQEIVKPGQML